VNVENAAVWDGLICISVAATPASPAIILLLPFSCTFMVGLHQQYFSRPMVSKAPPWNQKSYIEKVDVVKIAFSDILTSSRMHSWRRQECILWHFEHFSQLNFCVYFYRLFRTILESCIIWLVWSYFQTTYLTNLVSSRI